MSEEGDIPSGTEMDKSTARTSFFQCFGSVPGTKKSTKIKALKLEVSHLEDDVNTKSTTISNLTEIAEERKGEIDQCKKSEDELKCLLAKKESEAKAQSDEIKILKNHEVELNKRISQLENEKKSMSTRIENLTFKTTEMTIRARFTEISKISSTRVLSQPTEFAGLNWRLRLHKTDDDLSFFVEADAKNNTKEWSCAAIVEHQLISQKDENIVRINNTKKPDVFTNSNCWGQPKFISFKDLFDEEKGYVKDDSIIVSAVIKAFPDALNVTVAAKKDEPKDESNDHMASASSTKSEDQSAAE